MSFHSVTREAVPPIPLEQSTTCELVNNLTPAKALWLTIPHVLDEPWGVYDIAFAKLAPGVRIPSCWNRPPVVDGANSRPMGSRQCETGPGLVCSRPLGASVVMTTAAG